MLSVVIVQYNNSRLTKDAIESFRRVYTGPHEFLLVDNGSTEEDAKTLGPELEPVKCISNPSNEGFSRANNAAAKQASGEILLFLNNDTVTTTDFVTPILKEFERDALLGIAGPRLLNRDGSFQLSSGKLPSIGRELLDKIVYHLVDRRNTRARRYAERQSRAGGEVEWVTGAALFIRADVFRRLQGFDENLFMFFEDKDLCYRTRNLGFKIRYLPQATLVHLRGASGGEDRDRLRSIYRRSQILYYRKHRPKAEQILLSMYLSLTGKSPVP